VGVERGSAGWFFYRFLALAFLAMFGRRLLALKKAVLTEIQNRLDPHPQPSSPKTRGRELNNTHLSHYYLMCGFQRPLL
jgi:hypothetical protein